MDKKRYIDACHDGSLPHLPMGRLFYLLHSNGFQVKPDDYIEMLKVTERFGSKDIDETAKWICPILATSESEQQRFFHVIEEYKLAEAQSATQAPKEKKLPPWFTTLVSAICTLLILVAVLFSVKRSPVLLAENNRERTVQKNDTTFFNALNLLQPYPEDSSRVRCTWQYNDGTQDSGFVARHVFREAGDYYITRQFYSKNLKLGRERDSLLIHVCDHLPKLQLSVPPEVILVKKPVTITANVTAESGAVSFYQWTINDSVFTTSGPEVKDFVFSKEGDFPVECKAVVDNINSPCTASDNTIIQVLSNELHYGLKLSSSPAGTYQGKSQLHGWVTFLFLFLATVGFGYSLLSRKKRVPAAGNPPAAPKPASSAGPFDIPFEQTDNKLIQPEPALRKAFVQMRYKGAEENNVLNIGATIQSVIRSGGSPQLVFAPVTRPQEYLLLIERTNPKNMLPHFFTYLARSMEDHGIPVVIFYYDKNWMCYNDIHPSGLSLQRVADSWSHATLIIYGKAHELVYGVYPQLEEKYVAQFNRWQYKAIVTPQPLTDWSLKEKLLQEYMILVPADLAAYQKLVPALREKVRITKELLTLTTPVQSSLRDTDFRDMEALQEYLGGDEALFQWVCAICIYPRLKWEVLVAIGKVILDKYGCPESLNYTNLLAICRIGWMQQGVFPQSTRLELLKRLTVENEIAARQRLLQMLNYSTAIYGGGNHFFEEEKQRQVVTNQFILHASQHDPNNAFAASKESFKKLWQNDSILDVPVKKYLDKKEGDSWQTPVSDGQQSIGLASYFDLPEVTVRKKFDPSKLIIANASALLVAGWILLQYTDAGTKVASRMSLAAVQPDGLINVQMKVLRNFKRCGDSAQQVFNQLNGYLEIKNLRYTLQYNVKTATASYQIPYAALASGTAKLMFSWAQNKSVESPVNFGTGRLPDSVTIRCVDPDKIVKQNLNIRYNDTTGYKKVESKLEDALYRYNLFPVQVDFSDSSRLIYYETNQKGRADTIVRLIKRTLNIDVKEEFIQEFRTPPATPILFLNTSGNNIGTGASDPHEQTASDYHQLGDNYFAQKQYAQAIDAYAKAISLDPKDGRAWYQSGICYELLGPGNSNRALEAYNSAILATPSNPNFHYRRASLQYQAKQYEVAIAGYDRVLALNHDPTSTQYLSSLYFRGKSKLYIKNLKGACQDFKKAADAGYSAGEKDYGRYCEIQKAGNGSSTATDGTPAGSDYNPMKQQAPAVIPKLSAAQLADMLMEVTTGKKTDRDFLVYLRGNDIAVEFNGAVTTFTEMCAKLQKMKGISSINVVPTINPANNQVTNLIVTTYSGKSPRGPAANR